MGARRLAIIPPISHCEVDADGVCAEWVEAVVATPGQQTILLLHRSRAAGAAREALRSWAGRLAVTTGARILNVECSNASDGVTAYAWLLGEGLDLDTTTFLGSPADGDLPYALQRAAEGLGLPLPSGSSPQLPVGVHRGCRSLQAGPTLQRRDRMVLGHRR